MNPISTIDKPAESNFEGWCILEIMGHRKLGGYIQEANMYGASFIRLDTFTEQGEVGATQFYNPTAVYAITPTTQEIAIAFGLSHQPAPVQQWELPKFKAPAVIAPFADDEDEDEDEGSFVTSFE